MTNVVFDILARDKASKVFDKVGHSAEKTGGTFHKVSQTAGVALAGGLSLAAVGAIKAAKAAAEDQQAASRLAQTLQKATGATKGQIAANEQWITAQGKAYGVTDDDLRPAISRLAVATGSLSKAQQLAKLAMDVSAGSGKSLATVSAALVKAQNGQVAGLARLGVKTSVVTKDTVALQKAQISAKQAQLTYTAAVKAHGAKSSEAAIAAAKLKVAQEAVGAAQEKTKKTTMSMAQVTKELAAQYGGAAARNAQTAAGKQKILQVQMKELQEQIGAGLLPVLLKLATIGLSVVNWISNNTRVAGILAAALGGLLAVTWAVGAATKAWAAVTRVAAAAQWLLNAAMDANPVGLVVIALAALVASLVIAYKKSETFRNIVNGAFAGVKHAAEAAFGWIKDHWKLLASIIGGPIVAAAILVISNWSKIKAAAQAVVGAIRSTFSRVMSYIAAPFQAAIAVVSNVYGKLRGLAQGYVSFYASIPGKIAAAVGNLGHLLWNAGSQVIQGLIDGIQSKIGDLTGLLHHITSLIPLHKGPIGKDGKLLRPAGQAIMDGLMQGIADRRVPLQKALDYVTGLISKVGARISNLSSLRAGFRSTFGADSIFGQDFSSTAPSTTTVNGVTTTGADVTTPGSIADVLKFQRQQRSKARSLAHDVRKVTSMGLSKALVRQLESQGAAGAATLHALAQGSSSQIHQLNALDRQTSASLRAAGMRAGNYVRGGSVNADIRNARKQEHVLELLEHHLKDLAHSEKKGETIIVKIGEDAIIKAIHRYEKRTGKKTTTP